MTRRSVLIGCALATLAASTSVAVASQRSTVYQELSAKKGAERLLIQSGVGGTYTSYSFAPVTKTANFTIPSLHTGFLVATFTAQSQCTGDAGDEICRIRILCDGVELEPHSGSGFFNASGGAEYKSLSVIRHSTPFTGGTHSCEVQTATYAYVGTHRLDEFVFMVEFWRQK